jgi:glutaryl-CoA dehydrogenase
MTIFKKLKSTLQLVQNFDMDKIAKLSKKVDLNKMIGLVSSMRDEDLQKLVKFMEGGHRKHEFPAIDGDFYDLHQLLTPEE